MGKHAVFLKITHRSLPEISIRQDQARQIAKEIGQITGTPNNRVHVLFEPSAQGRIAFSDELS